MKDHILFISDLSLITQEVEGKGGHITQRCTKNVVFATLPETVHVDSLKHASTSVGSNADKISKMYFRAWKGFERSTQPIMKWSDPNRDHPKNEYNDPELNRIAGIDPPTSSSYLVGSVAVGIVVVAGKEPDLIFSSGEMDNLTAQFCSSFQALAKFEPLAKVTFVHEFIEIDVNVKPPKSCPDKETCEAVWRDPVLEELGYSANMEGVREYNKKLADENETDWSFTAFFTKYPLEHFAYAGDGRICMEYSNDGWGPDEIDAVFAHEIGHIFGAADEYGECDCDDSGYTKVPNKNCANCETNQVSCLMDQNVIDKLCQWSRGQLGWKFTIDTSEKTGIAPVSIEFKSKWYIAFKANDPTNRILICSTSDGISFDSAVDTKMKSGMSPSLTVHDDKLFLAFKANDITNRILVCYTTDGKKWSKAYETGQSSPYPPSIAPLNGKLFIAFQSNVIFQGAALSVVESKDGKKWDKTLIYTGQKTNECSMLYHKKKLYIAFVAHDPTRRILICSSSDGKDWSKEHETKQSTAGGLSLATYGSKIYLGFNAYDKLTGRLLICTSSNGKNWSKVSEIGEWSASSPGLSFYGEDLMMAFSSNDVNPFKRLLVSNFQKTPPK